MERRRAVADATEGGAPVAPPPRVRLRPLGGAPAKAKEVEGRTGGLYFTSKKSHLKFISSGSTMLDCSLGGGFVMGRVANIIGNKSTGKTLVAIETAANFAMAYPGRKNIHYRERESAFDKPYAGALGMPLDRVDFGKEGKGRFNTAEGLFEDLDRAIQASKGPGLYILDSLDSLSDAAELTRDIGDASYGTGKAKVMSEGFRRVTRDMEDAGLTLMIISQIRDKIGATFGVKTTRNGGRALDFYATHVIMLAHLGYMFKTISGIKRATGIRAKAQVTKNKVAMPFREAFFDLVFGYGSDDLASCMDYLLEVKRIDALGITPVEAKKYLEMVESLPDDDYRKRVTEVSNITKGVWREIENKFLPVRQKYIT